MESRNILLVVICICAFLVIIFGIGFVWSMPDRTSTENVSATDNDRESNIDIFEHVRDESDPPSMEPTDKPSEHTQLVVGEQEETDSVNIPADDENKEELTDREIKDETVTIEVPVTEKEDTKEKKEEYPTTWIAKPDPTPRPIQATTAPKKKQRVIEYWIQAGSFQSRTRADNQKERLAEHGFMAQIKTYEKDDITYYRLRIGPYNNKNEAQKFLEWLKVLIKDSYISEVYTQKYIN